MLIMMGPACAEMSPMLKRLIANNPPYNPGSQLVTHDLNRSSSISGANKIASVMVGVPIYSVASSTS